MASHKAAPFLFGASFMRHIILAALLFAALAVPRPMAASTLDACPHCTAAIVHLFTQVSFPIFFPNPNAGWMDEVWDDVDVRWDDWDEPWGL